MTQEQAYFESDDGEEIVTAKNFDDANRKAQAIQLREFKGLNNGYKQLLINRIGREIYYGVNGLTRPILLKNESQKVQQEIIAKYGSIHNYTLHWVKSKGYNTIYEYAQANAYRNGYDTEWHFRFSFLKKKHGIERPIELLEARARKAGYSSFKEYENELVRRRGFKDRREYRRFMQYWKTRNQSERSDG